MSKPRVKVINPEMQDLQGQEYLPGFQPKRVEERQNVTKADLGWCRVERRSTDVFDEETQDWKPDGEAPRFFVTIAPELQHKVHLEIPILNGLSLDQLCQIADSIKRNQDYLKVAAKAVEQQFEAMMARCPDAQLGEEYVLFRSVKTQIQYRLRNEHDDEE